MRRPPLEDHIVKTFPVREPVDGGPGRQYVIIKIKTDAGISGLGEAGIHFWGQAIERAVAHLSELLLGENPWSTERPRKLMFRGSVFPAGTVYS